MTNTKLFPIPSGLAETSWCNEARYFELYRQSIETPEAFWAKQAERLHWFKRWTKVKSGNFSGDIQVRWFEGGKLNASVNCIDRHLETKGDKIALIFEPDDPSKEAQKITYHQLYEEVCRWANVLKSQGVKKGDRVTIYMPMIPQAVYALLACARLGAVHSVIFGGFSPSSIAERIRDCESQFVITADEGLRGGKKI